jgi:hypothetical protein
MTGLIHESVTLLQGLQQLHGKSGELRLIVNGGKGDSSMIQRFLGCICGLLRSWENEQVRKLEEPSIPMQLDVELRFGPKGCSDFVRFRLHEVMSEAAAKSLQGFSAFDGPCGFGQ